MVLQLLYLLESHKRELCNEGGKDSYGGDGGADATVPQLIHNYEANQDGPTEMLGV